MGVDTNLKPGGEKTSQLQIVNETIRVKESSLTCTCDSQPFACEACDFPAKDSIDTIGQKEAVIRNRFRADKESIEALKTSDYDALGQGWVERDPETTQTFKRKQQVLNNMWYKISNKKHFLSGGVDKVPKFTKL